MTLDHRTVTRVLTISAIAAGVFAFQLMTADVVIRGLQQWHFDKIAKFIEVHSAQIQFKDTAGTDSECLSDFKIPGAEVLMTGLISPRGVAWEPGTIWVADGPRREPIRLSLSRGVVSLMKDADPCPDSSCGSVDMRGVAINGEEIWWLRHDLQAVPRTSDPYPLLPGPVGLVMLPNNTFLATGDYPSKEGKLMYVQIGQPVKVLDADLRNPTGIALSSDKIYVVESAGTETRWLVYDWNPANMEAARKAILGTVARAVAAPPAFEGIAVFGKFVFAAASDGLYIFLDGDLQGKLELKEGVSGVAVDDMGRVYFASGHSLLMLPPFAEPKRS